MELALLLLSILALFLVYIFFVASWRIVLSGFGMFWGFGWLAVVAIRTSWRTVSRLARRA
jgi:uncharacterized membrane protein YobD (UPF0266 family)